jgi:N-methylhydantoinase B
MLAEFDVTDLAPLGAYIIERSRLAMRDALQDWPPGTYSNAMTVDGYDAPIELCATITIAADGVLVDFTGTSPSVARGINVPKSYTDAYTSFGIRCLIGADVPNNAGSLAPIRVAAPVGSILNAQYPAAVSARHIIGQMLPDVMFGCLRQARPDRVPAEGASSLWNIHLIGGEPIAGGPNDALTAAKRFNITSFSTGGTGARPDKDGLSTTSFPSGVRNVSVEILESVSPILFQRKEYRPDSGGAGRARGGLGQTIEIRHADDRAPMIVAATFERIDNPARGALGGADGAPGGIRLASGAALKGKGNQVVPAGDRLIIETPGGGGLGDPRHRDRKSLARDLIDGLVTKAAAVSSYDVAPDSCPRSQEEVPS